MIITSQFHLLQFQVVHYSRRVTEARSLEERIWLKEQLIAFKNNYKLI